MSASLNRAAIRSLQREARRLIHAEGILNDNEVLQSVLQLVRQHTGRDRRRPITWTYVCDVVETSYVLGLVVGAHFTDPRSVVGEATRAGGHQS
jgi:hypothetical protein